MSSRSASPPRPASIPLDRVTFCVLDLETTGGSPVDDRICEIGAVKVCGGEVVGTFETLVDPGRGIPPFVSMLTGLTDLQVAAAPRLAELAPTVATFIGDAVIVAHNARFDSSFLTAEFERAGWPRLANPVVDTMILARRLFHEESPDFRLGTLADRLRLDHRPTHRAMTDALAACDLLHRLIERAAGFDVRALDDLLALPRQAGHPMAGKLRLTEHLPRAAGVYAFRGAAGEILYVGKATNLRQRVRSYFADDRRSVGALLRQAVAIDHRSCTSTLEAAVLEARLIRALRPRFNVAGKPAPSAVVRLDAGPFPRLVIGRRAPSDPAVPCLGPLPVPTARLVVEAIETAVPLRRCTTRLDVRTLPCRDAPCTAAQLGVASCPCAGTVGVADYAAYTRQAARALQGDVAAVLAALERRMAALGGARRFEEAGLVRDRASALAGAARRQHRVQGLRAAGTIELGLPGGATAVVRDGLLVDVDGDRAEPLGSLAPSVPATHGVLAAGDVAAEQAVVAAWLDAEGRRTVLRSVTAPFAVRWSPPSPFRAPTPRRPAGETKVAVSAA